MNDLQKAIQWLQEHEDIALGALGGALELYEKLRPQAEAQNVPIEKLLTGIPSADRALLQAAGLEAIAGAKGVDTAAILDVVLLLKNVAVALV